MASNLPSTQKEDWSLNDTVLPEHTNSWGSSINKLTKAIPIYASNGNYYKVQSFSNNIITLSPIADEDDSTNETVDSYVDGMQVIFQSTFDTTEDCSVNINNLGAKQIKTIKNKPISKGDITLGNFVQLIYSKNADVFYLVGPSQNGGGSGLEICDIGMSLYVDETKGLRRYLNGQIVDINTNTQAFLNRLQEITTLHPSLLCTEDEWQSAKTLSAFGQVGKFVFNYSNGEIVSVRIPRVVNVQGLFDLQNLGMTVSESLPNITGSLVGGSGNDIGFSPSAVHGAFYTTSETKNKSFGADPNTQYGLGFDASKSSSTYKDNAPVQQEAIQYPYFIQIATGSETENNIINEIELNNPYSLFDSKYSDHELNNLSWLKSSGQWNAKAVYTDAYDKILENVNKSVKGFLGQTMYMWGSASGGYMTTSLTPIVGSAIYEYTSKKFVGYATGVDLTIPAISFRDDVAGISYTNITRYAPSDESSSAYITDYDFVLNTADETFRLPLKNHTADDGKSVLTLYFYVGETVQNANLIDAGRIGEQLATKTDMLQASGASMPSSKYIDLTLGASGSTYTAPANGYVYVGKVAGGVAYISLTNLSNELSFSSRSTVSTDTITSFIPVSKGSRFRCSYSAEGATKYFRFIYAEGSK